jgi:hypothetical protein
MLPWQQLGLEIWEFFTTSRAKKTPIKKNLDHASPLRHLEFSFPWSLSQPNATGQQRKLVPEFFFLFLAARAPL